MTRPREQVLAALRLRDYGDGIDTPCKHTLAEQALYRVDAFEDAVAKLEVRVEEVVAREDAIAVREKRADEISRDGHRAAVAGFFALSASIMFAAVGYVCWGFAWSLVRWGVIG